MEPRDGDFFHRALAEGEAARHETAPAPATGMARIRRAVTRRLAETVAEQRLLWHLRRETAARFLHPDDLPAAEAIEIRRRVLQTDRDRHRRWCVIDGAIALASAPLTIVPGPNLPAYYFVFRTVAHYLAMKGAQQGLGIVAWTNVGSPHLTALRSALPLDPVSRARRVDEIAAALGLDRLAPFVEGVADGRP